MRHGLHFARPNNLAILNRPRVSRGRSAFVVGADVGQEIEKALRILAEGFFIKSGDTYFRVVFTIIGTESLTTVFEMGTGVTFRL